MKFGLGVANQLRSNKVCLYSPLGLKFPISGDEDVSCPLLVQEECLWHGRLITHFQRDQEGQCPLTRCFPSNYKDFIQLFVVRGEGYEHKWGEGQKKRERES